jgi:FAD/FMN-containing dehydrogenase
MVPTGFSTIPHEQGFELSMQAMTRISPVRASPGEDFAKVTVQAGARWRDVYAAFRESGQEWVVCGGLCPSVGVASFTLGGGAGPAARQYGLGLDGVLSFTMVTANGSSVVQANATHQPELFWALRGVGGGNLGVVTELTVKVGSRRVQPPCLPRFF